MSELSVGQLKGLPINNNVVTVPSGNTLYAPGHVVQVVQSYKVDQFTSASAGTWFDVPGMSVSITPKNIDSKILIIVTGYLSGQQNIVTAKARLITGSGAIIGAGTPASSQSTGIFSSSDSGASDTLVAFHQTFIHSPETASAITYKIQISADNASTIYFNRTVANNNNAATVQPVSSITLMEIAA